MASRLVQKAQLLKQAPIRQAVRNYASESKQAAEQFPEESKYTLSTISETSNKLTLY